MGVEKHKFDIFQHAKFETNTKTDDKFNDDYEKQKCGNAEMCHYQGLLHFISNHNDYDCYGYNQKYKCRNIFVSEYLYERSSEHSSV